MTKAGSPLSDETRSLGFWSALPRNPNQPLYPRAAISQQIRSRRHAMRSRGGT